jgi:putative peptidoglycan lipid II flippase
MRRIISFLFSSQYSVKRATALLAVTALLSNVLGLVRNILLYRNLSSEAVGIYFASFTVSDLVFNLLILGAVTSALIPVYTQRIERDGIAGGWEITNQVISWIIVVLGGIAIILALAMPWLLSAIFPTLVGTIGLTQTVDLSRVLLLQSLILAVSFAIGAILNCQQKFSSYSLAPLLYNGSIILGVMLAGRFGLTFLSWMVVAGAIIHAGIQYREAHRAGFRLRFMPKFDADIKEILRLMVPRTISLGVGQATFSYYLSLSSLSAIGGATGFTGVSAFRATNDLQTTPAMVVANPLASAFFPSLASKLQQHRSAEITALLTKALRVALYLVIPATAIAFILRAQIVRVYLGTGDASWPFTVAAIDTFGMFLVGVIPATIVVLLARVYYSLKDTRASTIISVIASLCGITAGWLNVHVFDMGVPGVALAVSIASIIQAGLYLYDLERRPGIDLGLPIVVKHVLRYTMTAIMAAGLVWLSLQVIHYAYVNIGLTYFSTRRIIGIFLQFLVAASIGATWYIYWSKRFHPEELRWLRTSLSSKS